ncbi:TetR/AcrR family transcriptional regulator [Jiella mangrovi]|uniref:TetR/AcrR family transcriptional regulator n=1 Tax=Jiella mangrovi TaxID=2821407 RepID=A0ABS4BFY5_9HYPH|nr:TetR/AcrR family transcriptional regulator [Jiella mangrovi]MBP0615675.1 TetR/AcrR family transcriptional regulator [Jiella mangrovi]
MAWSRQALARARLSRAAKARGGRPTREESERRQLKVMDAATRLFLERGFDATSIEAVAQAAGVSKATLYAHYTDKRGLFAQVLRARIGLSLEPLSQSTETQAGERRGGTDLAERIDAISRHMVDVLRQPEAISLQRILIAKAPDFPELADLAEKEGRLRVIGAVATLLEDYARRGEVTIEDPTLAADLFLAMVTGPYVSMPLLPVEGEEAALEERRQAAVSLFLRAIEPRSPAVSGAAGGRAEPGETASSPGA